MFTATEFEETRIGNRYGAKTSSSLRMVMENHFDARRRTMRDFPRFAKTVLVRFSLLDFWIPTDIRDCGFQSFKRLSG